MTGERVPRLNSPRSNTAGRRRRCSSDWPASSRHRGRARDASCSTISMVRHRAGLDDRRGRQPPRLACSTSSSCRSCRHPREIRRRQLAKPWGCLSLAAGFQPEARPLIPVPRYETSQKKKAPCKKHDALAFHVVCDQLVCWIADNSQPLPGRRAKVQTSVASPGCSLPATIAPVLRSSVLSVSAKRSATVA
ncbi:hypothetical protein ABIB06_003420 [Bradyrhizobium sp. LB8.2]